LDGDWTPTLFLKTVCDRLPTDIHFMNQKTTLLKPTTPPIVQPKIVAPPAKIVPTKTEAPPAKPIPVDKIATTVAVHLEIATAPDRDGLGAAWAIDTRESAGRVIGVSLYSELLLVSRALAKGDTLVLRYLASLVLCEFFIASRVSHMKEIQDILAALEASLGGPWKFRSNFSHLSTVLARNELTAKIEPVFEKKSFHWLSIPCALRKKSSLHQWNAELVKPTWKKGSTNGAA
jgi:hypothetical protein